MSGLSPTIKTTSASKLITVAAGCFWGTEHIYRKFNNQLFNNGLIDLKVGYANGITSDPDYKKVCTGATEFAESLQISYDPSKTSLKDLLDFFFRIHDPTTANQQGGDVGTQYRSAVFYNEEAELAIAKTAEETAQKEFYPSHKITTLIEPLENWYDAEDYHQLYLDKNPAGYQCPNHFYRTAPKI